jgi:hypothetical protein
MQLCTCNSCTCQLSTSRSTGLKGKGRAVDGASAGIVDPDVKKRVLAKKSDPRALYREVVRGKNGQPGIMTDADFWLGREVRWRSRRALITDIFSLQALLEAEALNAADDGDHPHDDELAARTPLSPRCRYNGAYIKAKPPTTARPIFGR